MKQNLGKGTDFFSFFGEFYKMMSDFYTPEDDEDYFDDLITRTNEMLKKYQSCDFIDLASGFLWVYLNWQEKKLKKQKIHWWKISLVDEEGKIIENE